MASAAARSVQKLFVGNLPWTISSRELRQYFSEFGHVSSAIVVFDRETGLSRGYGFITFGTSGAYDSVTRQQKHVLEGNDLTIQPAST